VNCISIQRYIKILLHEGLRYQSGRGFGSIFSDLFKTLKPLISMGLKAGKKIITSDLAKQGSTALNIGKDTLKNVEADLIEGQSASTSLDKGLETAKSTIANQIRGSGKRKKKKRACKSAIKHKKRKFNLLDDSDE